MIENTNETILINGDSLVEIQKLEDNSIDCVITDPPYFIGKLNDKWNAAEIKADEANSHIKHLPKGMKFDKNQVKNLYDFYLKMSRVIYAKLKPGGYFLSFSSPRLYHSIAMACEIAGFEVRDMINWVYVQSFPKGQGQNHNIEKMDLSQNEKNKLKKQFNGFKTPQLKSCCEPICVCMKPTEGTFLENELNWGTGLIDFNQKIGISDDKVPGTVLSTDVIDEEYDRHFLISKVSRKEKGNSSHPTIKPLELIEHLVKVFSKEGALVVDPFVGSGTTALACKNTGRKCIGIEINKEYFTEAEARINCINYTP